MPISETFAGVKLFAEEIKNLTKAQVSSAHIGWSEMCKTQTLYVNTYLRFFVEMQSSLR